MSVKIVYQDIAAGADEDATVTASDAQEFSHLDLLPFEGETLPRASLEPNSWLLDGSRTVEAPVRFWSTTMSGSDGIFKTPPEIVIDFGARYTSPGIFLHFDTATGEYCSSVTIQWRRGASLLAEENFYPDGVDFFCGKMVEAYDHILIRLNSTNLPYRYAKMSKIIFGLSRIFLRDELRNVKITSEASIISSEIAINTLNFTLDSEQDVDYLFQLKQPVSAYDGDSLIGVFYIDDSTHRAKGLYDISCIDAIGVLDEDTFPAGLYSGYSARALLLEILGGHFDLDLDPVLTGASVSGYLPVGTRREAMQQVAFALGAIVDTSGTNAIRIYRDRENTPFQFPGIRVYTGGTVETASLVTAVRVVSHAYRTEGSGNDTIEIDGQTYYHTTSTITINNPKATASDKQNVIEVDRATLINSGNAMAIAQHIYDYYTKRDTQRVKIVMNNERPGDRIAVPTPWGTVINGYITRMDIVLSGIAAADCEIIGQEVKATGDPETRFSGEFRSGEV